MGQNNNGKIGQIFRPKTVAITMSLPQRKPEPQPVRPSVSRRIGKR